MTKSTNSTLLREALKKDFNILYQKEFTTDWKEQKIVRGIEIDIMRLDALESLFQKYLEGEVESYQATIKILEECLKNPKFKARMDLIQKRLKNKQKT